MQKSAGMYHRTPKVVTTIKSPATGVLILQAQPHMKQVQSLKREDLLSLDLKSSYPANMDLKTLDPMRTSWKSMDLKNLDPISMGWKNMDMKGMG